MGRGWEEEGTVLLMEKRGQGRGLVRGFRFWRYVGLYGNGKIWKE